MGGGVWEVAVEEEALVHADDPAALPEVVVEEQQVLGHTLQGRKDAPSITGFLTEDDPWPTLPPCAFLAAWPPSTWGSRQGGRHWCRRRVWLAARGPALPTDGVSLCGPESFLGGFPGS